MNINMTTRFTTWNDLAASTTDDQSASFVYDLFSDDFRRYLFSEDELNRRDDGGHTFFERWGHTAHFLISTEPLTREQVVTLAEDWVAVHQSRGK